MGYTNFIKAIFRPIKRVKSSNFYLVLSRENSAVVITIAYIFCSGAVERGLDDVSNNLWNVADVPGSEIHVSPPTP